MTVVTETVSFDDECLECRVERPGHSTEFHSVRWRGSDANVSFVGDSLQCLGSDLFGSSDVGCFSLDHPGHVVRYQHPGFELGGRAPDWHKSVRLVVPLSQLSRHVWPASGQIQVPRQCPLQPCW